MLYLLMTTLLMKVFVSLCQVALGGGILGSGIYEGPASRLPADRVFFFRQHYGHGLFPAHPVCRHRRAVADGEPPAAGRADLYDSAVPEPDDEGRLSVQIRGSDQDGDSLEPENRDGPAAGDAGSAGHGGPGGRPVKDLGGQQGHIRHSGNRRSL